MVIEREKALEIAEQDASLVYSDLSIYDVSVSIDNNNWKIDYNLKDKTLRGGGPHYVISGATGEILQKQYEQ
jgi:hypothetical protein